MREAGPSLLRWVGYGYAPRRERKRTFSLTMWFSQYNRAEDRVGKVSCAPTPLPPPQIKLFPQQGAFLSAQVVRYEDAETVEECLITQINLSGKGGIRREPWVRGLTSGGRTYRTRSKEFFSFFIDH